VDPGAVRARDKSAEVNLVRIWVRARDRARVSVRFRP
jgi:hypothetical protein